MDSQYVKFQKYIVLEMMRTESMFLEDPVPEIGFVQPLQVSSKFWFV